MPCWAADALLGGRCLVGGLMPCWGFLVAPCQHQCLHLVNTYVCTLSTPIFAPCQHQADEREAEGETEGEAEDEWQRGRGTVVGSKAGVRKRMSQTHARGGGKRRRSGVHPL